VWNREASIYKIINTIKLIKVGVYIEYTNGRAKKKKDDTFETNIGLFLIRDCDRLAKETYIECE